MTIESVDSSFLVAGRDIRTEWRVEEEDFIAESIEYAKRKMSMLDYLASVAHAGHEIAVLTPSFQTEGQIVHIGSDFFSIVCAKKPRFAQSFVVGNAENPRIDGIEIDVRHKSDQAENFRLVRHVKSFRSLLEDIARREGYIEIETRHENIYQGTFELFSNFISFIPKSLEKNDQSLVQDGAVIIPIDGIVSVLYAI